MVAEGFAPHRMGRWLFDIPDAGRSLVQEGPLR